MVKNNTFNGIGLPRILLLHEDGSVEMIRRAETPQDYFRTFDCFAIYDKLFPEKK